MTGLRPVVLVTCGDPAGIGPEIAWKAWQATSAHGRARLRIVGDPEMISAALAGRHGVPPLPCETIDAADGRPSTPDAVVMVPVPRSAAGVHGSPSSLADRGRAAAAAVEAAVGLVQAGHADAIVTGPLNKEALHAAGYDVPGHTELLARACGLPDDAASMMLWLPMADGRRGLGVVHVTLHEPLRVAIDRLTPAGIVAAGLRIAPILETLVSRRPRIAVAALNPHGGEGGLFGDEEARLVTPAVRTLQAANIDVTGPLPADTLFLRAAGGEFDGVVALYHDQGHIPVKLLGMHRAVNITLGLPLVRTSVAHGTALDIVGTGRADPASMLAAIAAAERLVAARGPRPAAAS